jgi:hypothetical protein
MPWSRLVGCVLVASVSGCAGRTSQPAALSPSQIGTHAFQAELPGGVRYTGTVTVTEDTIVARPAHGECRLASTGTSRQQIVYECVVPGAPNVILALDRANPVRRSTWGMETTVRKSRSICTAWRTWENGTRTCTRSEPEEYFEKARLAGTLMMVPP